MQDVNKIYTTQARLPDDTWRYLESPAACQLMESLRDYGVSIKAESGGAYVCATFHIHIQQEGQTAVTQRFQTAWVSPRTRGESSR